MSRVARAIGSREGYGAIKSVIVSISCCLVFHLMTDPGLHATRIETAPWLFCIRQVNQEGAAVQPLIVEIHRGKDSRITWE